MLFFISPERQQALKARLKKLLCVPFSFSTRGSQIVVYEQEEAYSESLSADRDAVYA
jgi:hypothetical protein